MKSLCQIKLVRIWFLIWFISAAIYLIVKAIQRYLEFKTLQNDKVFDRAIDNGIMNFYLTCIIAAITLGIIGVYCTVFRTGCYANDSVQFGDEFHDFKSLRASLQREQMTRELRSGNRCCGSKFQINTKYHCPSLYLGCYCLMSMVLLVALPYLEAEKIRIGFGITNSPMHTNLDFIFCLANEVPTPSDNIQINPCQSLSFEFFNLGLSLLLHTFSYSHVFWKFNKLFSILFSMVIFASGLYFLLDNALVEMLVKLSRDSNDRFALCTPRLITAASMASFVLLLVHQMSLFHYGYIRMAKGLLVEELTGTTTYNDSSNPPGPCSVLGKQWREVVMTVMVGYLSLLLSVCCRLIYLYRTVTVIYPEVKDGLILSNIVVGIIFLVLMSLLWFGLLLRSNWQIKLQEQSVSSNGMCSQLMPMNHNHARPLPIYASVNRQPVASPPLGQDPNFSLFGDPGSGQWRYSCSPQSCRHNDSNSDRTTSCKNDDLGIGQRSQSLLRRGNPIPSVTNSPSINHGIYSQLIKLIPQNSFVENNNSENVMALSMQPTDISDSSSNHTVHIIGRGSLDRPQMTFERSSTRARRQNSTEYFNISNYNPNIIVKTEPESVKLCSQV